MDNDSQHLSRTAAACLIVFLVITPSVGWSQPSGDELALKLRDNVVKISAKRDYRNTSFIIQLGNQLRVDAILLFSANVVNLGKDRIRAILVDVKRGKAYSKSGLTDFLITEDIDLILEAGFDTKEIAKRVFAEYKSNYNR